jgi:hypothetical protein
MVFLLRNIITNIDITNTYEHFKAQVGVELLGFPEPVRELWKHQQTLLLVFFWAS